MPYSHEHSCRIRNPGTCQKESFRRTKSKNQKLDLIICRPNGKKTTTVQSFRYPEKKWSQQKAHEHCRKQGGTFHPKK